LITSVIIFLPKPKSSPNLRFFEIAFETSISPTRDNSSWIASIESGRGNRDRSIWFSFDGNFEITINS